MRKYSKTHFENISNVSTNDKFVLRIFSKSVHSSFFARFCTRIEVDFSNWVINKLWNMCHEKSNMEHKSQSKKTQISVEWCFLKNLKMEMLGVSYNELNG